MQVPATGFPHDVVPGAPGSIARINWQAGWQELDLITGLVVESNGAQTLLDPAAFGVLPRNGIQLAGVQVRSSAGSDRIFVGVGSSVDGGAGADALFNSESRGENWLVGGIGPDRFFLRQAMDVVVGGSLITGTRTGGLAPGAALVDGEADQFLIDSSERDLSADPLRINDFEPYRDVALIDGVLAQGSWLAIRQALEAAGVIANAAPEILAAGNRPTLTLLPGVESFQSFATLGTDPDNDPLRLVVLEGPDWLASRDTTLNFTAPAGLTAADLAGLDITLGLYDGKAVTPFVPELALGTAPVAGPETPPQPSEDDTIISAIHVYGGILRGPVRGLATGARVSASSMNNQRFIAADGFELGERALDFTLDLFPWFSQATVSFDLADVLAEELFSGPNGRQPARRFGYFSIDASGALAPLIYDPLRRSGARFYDRNGDGIAEFLSFSLADGGSGDRDGLVNGVVGGVSAAAVVDLNPVFSLSNNLLTLSDSSKASAPASLVLRASLSNRASTTNQIGYVVLDSSEVASAASLLADPSFVKGRAQTLFSSLENTDVTLPSGSGFDREILLLNGQSIRFFEVRDATIDQITSLNDPRFRFLAPGSVTDAQALLSSTSGVRFSLSLLNSDQGLNALIGQEQGMAPVLDFSNFAPTEVVSGSFVLSREADIDSITGFYRTLDAQGSVFSADGITVLRPGDAGYAAAALRSDNLVRDLSNLQVADDQTSTRAISVSESSFLAPFARVNGDTFFAFGAANSDGLSHFRTLGTNMFGLEDTKGGGDLDFDDLIIGFSFTSLSTSPLLA
ncbi:MAG: DUF4114 domain-containing protein [Cyanobacteria bacterium]|nr:DUF4114 domain-containing protein [Cyanobacteria bacterium bin.51]